MITSAESLTSLSNIQRAAAWLATGGAKKGEAVVPQLQREFGLTALECCHAIRDSNLMRARAA